MAKSKAKQKEKPKESLKGKAARRRNRVDYSRNHYTPSERVAAVLCVRVNGGDIRKASRMTGIPYNTIREWCNGKRQPYVLQLACAMKGDMEKAFESAAWQFLGYAMGKAEKAAFNHLMTGAGIAFDKMRLLRGEPTTINENENRNVNIDVARLTREEQQALALLLEKATPDGTDGPERENSPEPAGQSRDDSGGVVPPQLPGVQPPLVQDP